MMASIRMCKKKAGFGFVTLLGSASGSRGATSTRLLSLLSLFLSYDHGLRKRKFHRYTVRWGHVDDSGTLT